MGFGVCDTVWGLVGFSLRLGFTGFRFNLGFGVALGLGLGLGFRVEAQFRFRV